MAVNELEILIRPAQGLTATFDVTDADGTVLGVIAETGDHDWMVLSTRYGAPEPTPGRHPSRWAAALTLV